MSAIEALVLMAVLSVAPAVLFLALLSGLRRRQGTPMMTVYGAHSDIEVREVTFQDAARGVLGRQADYTERPSNDEYRF